MSWLYGEPVKGDISEFRLVRMDFCYGAGNEYIMHKDHVARFAKASVKLHHTPGINPANKEPTSRIWKITSAPLHGSSYWWTTPSLEGNDNPEGATIVKGGPSETVFIDREYVACINREEDEMGRSGASCPGIHSFFAKSKGHPMTVEVQCMVCGCWAEIEESDSTDIGCFMCEECLDVADAQHSSQQGKTP